MFLDQLTQAALSLYTGSVSDKNVDVKLNPSMMKERWRRALVHSSVA